MHQGYRQGKLNGTQQAGQLSPATIRKFCCFQFAPPLPPQSQHDKYGMHTSRLCELKLLSFLHMTGSSSCTLTKLGNRPEFNTSNRETTAELVKKSWPPIILELLTENRVRCGVSSGTSIKSSRSFSDNVTRESRITGFTEHRSNVRLDGT